MMSNVFKSTYTNTCKRLN